MSEHPEFVFVAYDGDMTTENYDISVSLEAGSLVGKPVKYIRHDINTRAVPDVPELVRYRLHWSDFDAADMEIDNKGGEYVLYSQAAAVIEEARLQQKAWTDKWDAAISRAEAAEAKLAQYEAQEPVGSISDSNGVLWYSHGKSDGKIPLYASPAPAADLKAEIERLREVLRKAHASLEIDRTGRFEEFKNIINLALDGDANA